MNVCHRSYVRVCGVNFVGGNACGNYFYRYLDPDAPRQHYLHFDDSHNGHRHTK